MATLVLSMFRLLRLLMSGHQAVALENVALRIQIAAFQQKRSRPVLTGFDRFFWVALRQLWSDWRRPLVYVQPDTVVRWQRERFRKFWARLSQPRGRPRGRLCVPASTRRLIEQMAACNPLCEEFGEDRLRDFLQSTAAGGAEAIESVLPGALDEFTKGAAQTDDITLVLIQRWR